LNPQRQFSPVSGVADLNAQFKRARVSQIFKDADGSLWFATTQGFIFLPKSALRFDYVSDTTGNLKVTEITGSLTDEITFVANYQAWALQPNITRRGGPLLPRQQTLRVDSQSTNDQ
jgi:ligand-binding sensor domain-containing protein